MGDIKTPQNRLMKFPHGKVELVWNIGFAGKWNRQFKRAQVYIDSEVLRLSTPYTPFLTSMLVKSATLGTIIGSGEVKWIAPHARYSYYGKLMVGSAPKKLTSINLRYNGAPKRGAYWFERMKADHKRAIIQGAARIAGGHK